MTPAQIIKAAIPNADESLIEHILWGRTPFPMGKVTERSLYKAASGYRRACANHIRLCDFCEHPAMPDKWACERCDKALSGHMG